jgi:hypothetical protein
MGDPPRRQRRSRIGETPTGCALGVAHRPIRSLTYGRRCRRIRSTEELLARRKAAPRQYSRPPTGGTTPLHGRATASTTPTSANPPTTTPSHSAEASALHSRGGPRHPRTGSLNPQRSSGGGALSTPSRRGPACRRSTGTDGSSWPTRRATSSACATAAPGCGSTAGAPGRERRSVPAGVERTLVLTPARDGRAGRRAPRSGTGARPVNYCAYLSTPRSRPEGECSSPSQSRGRYKAKTGTISRIRSRHPSSGRPPAGFNNRGTVTAGRPASRGGGVRQRARRATLARSVARPRRLLGPNRLARGAARARTASRAG